MRSKGRSEAEVQAGVLGYLALRGDVFFWRQGNFSGALPGGFMHATRGVPDVLCVKEGRLYGLEIKREIGGTVSADQKRFGLNLEGAGGVYAVVRSVEDAQRALGPVGPSAVKFGPERVIHRD